MNILFIFPVFQSATLVGYKISGQDTGIYTEITSGY